MFEETEERFARCILTLQVSFSLLTDLFGRVTSPIQVDWDAVKAAIVSSTPDKANGGGIQSQQLRAKDLADWFTVFASCALAKLPSDNSNKTIPSSYLDVWERVMSRLVLDDIRSTTATHGLPLAISQHRPWCR